MGGPEAVSVT